MGEPVERKLKSLLLLGWVFRHRESPTQESPDTPGRGDLHLIKKFVRRQPLPSLADKKPGPVAASAAQHVKLAFQGEAPDALLRAMARALEERAWTRVAPPPPPASISKVRLRMWNWVLPSLRGTVTEPLDLEPAVPEFEYWRLRGPKLSFPSLRGTLSFRGWSPGLL